MKRQSHQRIHDNRNTTYIQILIAFFLSILLVTTAYANFEPNELELYQSAIREFGLRDYQKAFELFWQLLRDYPDSPNAPLYLFRCGELADKHLQYFDVAIQCYGKLLSQFSDCFQAPHARKRLSALKGYKPEWNVYTAFLKIQQLERDHIELFKKKYPDGARELIDAYPEATFMEEMLRYQGYYHLRMDEPSEALRYFQRLKREFPNADDILEIRRQIGYRLMDVEEFDAARQEFLDLFAVSPKETHDQALLKEHLKKVRQAWWRFRMWQLSAAIFSVLFLFTMNGRPWEVKHEMAWKPVAIYLGLVLGVSVFVLWGMKFVVFPVPRTFPIFFVGSLIPALFPFTYGHKWQIPRMKVALWGLTLVWWFAIVYLIAARYHVLSYFPL